MLTYNILVIYNYFVFILIKYHSSLWKVNYNENSFNTWKFTNRNGIDFKIDSWIQRKRFIEYLYWDEEKTNYPDKFLSQMVIL